jgi:hypothetical protein
MSEEISDQQVDSMLAEMEGSGTTEIPMGDEAPAESAAPAAQAPAQTQAPAPTQTYKLKINGQDIEATPEQLYQWAQRGYDAPNKIGEVNKKLQEYESKYKPYQEIDAFARENPEWWQNVQELYAQREALRAKADPSNPLTQELLQVKDQLSQLHQFKDSVLEQQTRAKHAQEDQALDQSIKSIREKHPNLDWNAADQNGYNLEKQILKFGSERGLPDFDSAFKLYCHDKLLSLEAERAKEAMTKDIQKKTKLGLLKENSAPKTNRENVKAKSYNNLEADILEEWKSQGVI